MDWTMVAMTAVMSASSKDIPKEAKMEDLMVVQMELKTGRWKELWSGWKMVAKRVNRKVD